MNKLTELHEQAMELADQAFIAKRRGNEDLALKLSAQAFELEAAAAELLNHDTSIEPSRSVLYRSAASLALNCGRNRDAERLIATALAGNPPPEIAEELRDLLEQVYFSRHLELRDISLESGELQFSIAGNAIGYGIALSEVFVERIKDMERLIYRTVERKLQREFRERGPTKRSINEGYSLYIAAPRPGSFVVTLRLGRQMELPGFDLSGEVIDEVVDCFTLLNAGQIEQLKERIPEEPYYNNFIGLAKRIAPDGDEVSMVGITTMHSGEERKVAITRKQRDISYLARKDAVEEAGKIVVVKGRLLLADARKSERKIQLIEDSGQSHTIVVPEGMMNDIVRPLWNDIVTVTGVKINQKIHLREIARSPE